MKYLKPYLFHSGAVTSLADGSGKIRLQRVEQASYVMQAHDLFGLREHIGAVLSESNVGVAFGKRIRTVLNGADKVASISPDLAVFHPWTEASAGVTDRDLACTQFRRN